MNAKEFDMLVDEVCADTKNTLCSKAKEYASAGSRFHNFEAAARMEGIDRKQALWGMALKHLVAVKDMIDNPKQAYSYDYVREKCGDLRNYLILLEGMLREDTTFLQNAQGIEL